MMMDAIGVTNPAAGVTATRPATAPEAAPRTVGLPRWLHSVNIQPSAAAAAAVLVVVKAWAARPLAPSALPPLKPNQPNHRSPAPITVMGRLCGGMGWCPYPLRLPMTRAAASAETPDEMCTTVPPAKSSAPRLRSHPPTPQTQWASGSYTKVAHARTKMMKVEKRFRSANAPVMRRSEER